MTEDKHKQISELKVRFSKNEAHFINQEHTRLFFNNYKLGRDGINKTSIRYSCLT